MAEKSFKQMINSGEIKRADAMKVRLEDIHIEPGFNLRDKESPDEDGVTFQDSINALADYLAGGGQVPPLEVRPRDEGGVWIVEGERRTLAWRQLDAEGRLARDKHGEFWVNVVPFTGDKAQRTARIMTSNTNRRLTDLERAEGCKRLRDDDSLTPEQIAKAIGMTRQRVDQLLILADASGDVHQAIKSGAIAGTTAVELVRKHGEQAGAVIATELDKAKAAGKGKITAGTIKGPQLPRSILDDLLQQAEKVSRSLTTEQRVTLDEFHRGVITEGRVKEKKL